MVVGMRAVSKLPASQRERPSVVSKRELSVGKSFAIRSLHIPNSDSAQQESGSEAGDVIDLGAPRRVRRAPVSLPRAPRLYTPNPRLYPGPKAKDEPKRRSGRSEASRPRRRKRKFCRPVPNSRLYRPAPPRARPPPPPSPRPRAAWSPPAGRVLESASRVALRVLRARSSARPPSPPPPAAGPLPPAAPSAGRRLVVTLPAAGDARCAMSAPRHSTSPECSDGNDPSSAPSEFLSEFLSAIMRRQYAEALDYCRLILQYEPHNATARGFYPLLRHKLRVQSPPPPAAALKDETSSSEENSPEHGRLSDEQLKQSVETECSAEVSASEGACSSLELDSSEPASPRRTDTSDPSDSSSWHWDSGGSHSERDDNGNPTARHGADDAAGDDADLRNDNPPLQVAQGVPEQTSSRSSLQRLRAHFACSIK